MVRRPVADTPGVWRGGPGESSFLKRQVGVQVDLGSVGSGVAFSGVQSCVLWLWPAVLMWRTTVRDVLSAVPVEPGHELAVDLTGGF